MPIEVAPNRIELTELSGGYAPDAAEAAVPPDSSPAMTNLLPMPWGNELRLRYGFVREPTSRATSLAATHVLRHMYYYELIDSGVRKRYIMCVMTTNAVAANNVQIWAYDLVANSFTRVDTADRSWSKPSTEHWGAVIEGTYYGGTRGELPYSWHPTTGWNATPTTPTDSLGTWTDTQDTNTTGSRDFAYKKGDTILYSSSYYKAARNLRFKKWETSEHYRKGEKVSRKAAVSGITYWRSYECIRSHDASTDRAPGTGSETRTFWKKLRLDDILDADSVISDDWFLNPVVRKASVGAYHGNRLWVRADDNDNWARLQYSAPAKPEKGAVIADLDFDPTDWAAVDDNEGDGGGWFTVPFSGKGDAIRALHSYGNYLVISGRWQTFVLSGLNESTWTLRKLGNYGSCSIQSICELDGLVYQLGRAGILTVTDGTTMQPVAGMEKIRKWLKKELDDVLNDSTPSTGANWFPNLTAHDGYIWISLPDESSPSTSRTLVYDPRSASFWDTDLRMLDMCTGEDTGVERLWFSTTITKLTTQAPQVFRYGDDPGTEIYVDDDWQSLSGTAATDDISWDWRSAWFQFGTTRNERRIRRAWALIGGEAAQSVIVRLFKNFNTTYTTTATRTLTGQATQQAEYVEGAVGQGGTNAYSVGIRASGTANAETVVHGVGIDTEPRRTRFHRGT